MENKGTVRIMVHPYYIQQHSHIYKGIDTTPYQRFDMVENGFKKILKTKSNTPVFLFESFNEIKRTEKKIIPILRKNQNKIFIVPTETDSPNPRLNKSYDTNLHGWSVFIEKMENLGVKKIIIGGIFLDIITYEEEEWVTGCVGFTIEKLKDNFEIQISNLAHPKSRKDFTRPNRKI